MSRAARATSSRSTARQTNIRDESCYLGRGPFQLYHRFISMGRKHDLKPSFLKSCLEHN
jgi:hypothetical protein